jgi:hypothetical protein
VTGPDAPDGGPNNPRRPDPITALAGEVHDLTERVDALAGQFDGVDPPWLRQQVDQLADQLAALMRPPDPQVRGDQGGQVPHLHAALIRLAEDVATLMGDGDDDGAPALPCWVDLDAGAAQRAWTRLHEWVRDVLLARHPYITTSGARPELSPCWYRHPAAVEELSWLHITWCRAYRNPDASPTEAADWHDKWLPRLLERLPRLVPCRGRHTDDPATGPAVDDDFAAFVAADVGARPVRPQPGA